MKGEISDGIRHFSFGVGWGIVWGVDYLYNNDIGIDRLFIWSVLLYALFYLFIRVIWEI